MLRWLATGVMGLIVVSATASRVEAQGWSGVYVGGSAGGALQKKGSGETIRFDTNLDGAFTDTVRTVAGAEAFSPGFCGGLAVGPAAASGCNDDESGSDFGGRVGYDRAFGSLIVGALVDVSRTERTDSATAFSTTPAFYSFTRELNHLAGLRGRVGFGSDRLLVYGTAGGARGSVDQRFTTSNTVNTFVARDDRSAAGDSTNVWGYQAGGGVEVRLGARLSLAGEYLFTSLDNRDESVIRAQGPAAATNPFLLVNASGTDFQRSDEFEFQALRLSLNYRF